VLQRIRDLRRSPRIPKRQAASIAPGSNGARLPCTIWDISEHGARLAAPHPKSLPATFTLFLSKDGSSRKYCRVAWRSDAQVGVQFVEGGDDDEVSSPSFRPGVHRLSQLPSQRPSPPGSAKVGGPNQFVSLQKISVQANGAARSGSSARRGAGPSFLAALLVTALIAATGVFYYAASFIGDEETSWANDVCGGARNFCEHPEITGISALLVVFIFMAAKGMQRD
jgi:hypothetical protein